MTGLFHETMTALERSLTCGLIASDLDLQNGAKPFSVPDDDILELAMQHRYSRVPLRDDNSGRKVEITHVAIVDLAEPRVQDRRVITIDDLIAAETPLHRAIDLLLQRGFCFVLVHEAIRKILTRSDLNKLPVRVYLSTLLAHLEGMMADTIDAELPNNGWMKHLSDKRQQSALDLHQQKIAEDFDTRLIDCTTLSDKAKIIRNLPRFLRHMMLRSKNQVDQQYEKVKGIRNRLDHGLPPLTEDTEVLRDHLYHDQQLTKVRNLTWLADVVATMHAWIDVLATLETEGGENGA